MRKTQASPVHVRLPPDDLEALRTLAERRGSNLHAEVVRAVQMLLADEGGDPEVAALKTATLATLEASHGGLGDTLGNDWLRRQFKAAIDTLLDALGTDKSDTRFGCAAAEKVLKEMRGGGPTPLGEAGRVLGVGGKS